jgi:elongation factor 1-beta
MSLIFSSTSSDAGLEQLNNYFVGNTYVFGIQLTAGDATLFAAFNGTAPDAAKYPHVARYYSHVASFSDKERAAAAEVVGLSVSIGAAPAGGASKGDDDDDDDSGLDFLSDDDDDDEDPVAAAKKKAEEKAKAVAAAKKAKKRKGPPVAKSRVVFEIKPYDVETDLEELAKKVKACKLEGEFWDEKLENCEDPRCTLEEGAKWGEGHRLQPIAFGISKLIVQVIIQDELVGSDDLIEMLTDNFEDDIQSIDVAAFDKAS